jgi:hypothetical protein
MRAAYVWSGGLRFHVRPLAVVSGRVDSDGHLRISRIWLINLKQPKSTILAKRVSTGPRGRRTRAQPRQYTVADLERARDPVEAAERRIDNDHTSNLSRARAGLERAQLELHIIELQLRLRGLLE